jgi:hypothetical protein
MLMKSDPYTIPATPLLQAHEEQQKQTWIEERKSEWLNQERAAWHAGGKQTPWAEWLGEQEFKWENELPHHEREWAQQYADKREKLMEWEAQHSVSTLITKREVTLC